MRESPKTSTVSVAISVFLVLLWSSGGLVADTRVYVGIGGREGSTCEGASPKVVVIGSLAMITATVLPSPLPKELPFDGFPETQPAWLKIEVAYVEDSDPFIASTELLALVNPRYFLDMGQTVTNETWREDDDLTNRDKRPIYNFLIDIPEVLAGKTICVRAVITDPPYGPVVVEKYADPLRPTVACLQIVAPCSPKDLDRALESQISYNRHSRNFERAIQIADSLADAGRPLGLIDALTSARFLGRLKSELRFLDLQYQTTGSVVPRQEGVGKESPEIEKRKYLEKREKLVRRIAEQEQQR